VRVGVRVGALMGRRRAARLVRVRRRVLGVTLMSTLRLLVTLGVSHLDWGLRAKGRTKTGYTVVKTQAAGAR
jgi:hypothetical protein